MYKHNLMDSVVLMVTKHFFNSAIHLTFKNPLTAQVAKENCFDNSFFFFPLSIAKQQMPSRAHHRRKTMRKVI